MKKIYALIVVFTCCYAKGHTQGSFTWNGSVSEAWNTAANWTLNSGTAGPGYPDASNDNATFNTTASVLLEDSYTLNSLTVSGSGTDVTILGVDFPILAVTNASSALSIANGAILRLSTMDIEIGNSAKGTIAGTLSLEGAGEDFGRLVMPGITGQSATLTVTGSIVCLEDGNSIFAEQDNYLRFNSGGKLELRGANNPIIPKADYNPASEVIITGLTTASVACDESGALGIITYNCPGQLAGLTLDINSGMNVAGDINVLNTNGQRLTVMSNAANQLNQTEWLLTVGGSLNISGNSKLAISTADNDGQTYKATILGSINAGGQEFSLQNSAIAGIDPTIVYLSGSINHSSGAFFVNATHVSEATHLYVIEMKGSGTQTINSYNGLFDDGTGQFTLRINNAAGVTLSSDLTVGRVSFNSANKGVIKTNANYLGLTNPSNNSLVMEASGATGYIDGNLRRTTSGTSELVFAFGAPGNKYYPISVIPQGSSTSVYEASFTNSAYSDQSVVAPITAVAPYYWIVNKISGEDAKLKLTLNGAIDGATGADAYIAVKYNGNDWIDVKFPDSKIPGDQTSGTLETQVMSTFSPFSIGYALNAALPIHLISFSGKKLQASAQLNWKITDNSTPETFEVLKSADGIHFSAIGSVSGFSGKFNYEYIDNSLIAGNNYYRLRMIDKDGSLSYSPIVVIMNGTKGVMISSMIPTMVVDRARLNISSSERGSMQLVVTDMSGRIVHTQNAEINVGNQEIWLNASRISSGIFQITGYMKGEKTSTFRFFKR